MPALVNALEPRVAPLLYSTVTLVPPVLSATSITGLRGQVPIATMTPQLLLVQVLADETLAERVRRHMERFNFCSEIGFIGRLDLLSNGSSHSMT